MRKNLVALFIVALILGLGTYEHFYLDNVYNKLEKETTVISEMIENKDIDNALEKISETQKWWKEKNDLMEIFSYNCDVKYVLIYLAEMEGSLKSENREIALSRAYALNHLVKEIKNNTEFFVVNIF